MIEKALEIAFKAHEGQFRKNKGLKIPYIMHPIAVFNHLISAGEKDEKVLATALLHDSIEDAQDRSALSKIIEDNLGTEILGYVLEVTLPLEACGKFLPGQIPQDKKKLKYEHIGNQMRNGSLVSKKVKIADRHINVKDFYNSGKTTYAINYAKMFIDACELEINFSTFIETDSIFVTLLSEFMAFFYQKSSWIGIKE